MFSISKLFWLGIILVAVWNIFRIIEKRQGLRYRDVKDSDTTGEKADSESEPIAAVYCATCATFTAGAGCDRADCDISS